MRNHPPPLSKKFLKNLKKTLYKRQRVWYKIITNKNDYC